MYYLNNKSNYVGWQYLLNQDFREHVNQEWHSLPSTVVGLQILAGLFSILLPVSAAGLTLFLLMVSFF